MVTVDADVAAFTS